MEEEISGLVRNGVWVKCDLPNRDKPIGTKWVFKRKVNQLGEVVRYEGKLVALVFQQREGRDSHKTYMPTPSPAFMRIAPAVAAAEEWDLFHGYIAQAFITVDVEGNIYISLCDGCGPWSGKIVKLRKALYGTRQARRAFH
ncbi:unnamed protein product, partial [Discosporangium mesarthrocarpum]